jgi:hypothetical protein
MIRCSLIFLAFSIFFLSSSCQIEKRLYRNGWNIQRGSREVMVKKTERQEIELSFLHESEDYLQEHVSVPKEKTGIIKFNRNIPIPKQTSSAINQEIILQVMPDAMEPKKIPSENLDDLYRILLIMAAFFIIIIGIVVLATTGFLPSLIFFGLAAFCVFLALAPDWLSDSIASVIVNVFRGIRNILLNWR